MTIHDRARELAATAIDFDLSPAERDELDVHLRDCEPCRTFAEALNAHALALSQMPVHDAPAELRRRIADSAAHAPADDDRAAARRGREERRPLLALPTPYRRPALLVAVAAAVVVAVVGTSLAWRQSPSNPPGVAVASPSPGGSSGPNGSSSPIDLPVPQWAAVAELTPIDGKGPVVSPETAFHLASLDGTPAADLATRLSVEPKFDFAVATDPDGSARITPSAPLEPGAVYRFSLASPTGQLLDSWAFQAKQPVRVVATLPDNQATDVPVDTGIEITFDQDGVADPASHVKIEPATKGRFEQHGRVLVFVPTALKFATIYTVTVSHGITVPATGETMADDVTFQFETTATSQAAAEIRVLQFQDNVSESPITTRPVIGLWQFGGSQQLRTHPGTTRIDVYRLPDLESAIAAFRQVEASPRWARLSAANLVPTAGLTRVVSFDATLNVNHGALWFSLPEPLHAGWYLVQHPSKIRAIQTILQVTDIAGYLAVSSARTVVWANDVSTGRPVSGATVTSDGTNLGRTDARGLLAATTPLVPADPKACEQGCRPIVTVLAADGGATFLPTSGITSPDGYSGALYGPDRSGGWKYWLLFHSDRSIYRSTDTINTFGVIRDRDSGAVPEAVTVRLVPVGGGDSIRPAVSTLVLKPGPTGAFAGSIASRGLPIGWYELDLLVGAQVVGGTQIQVDRILKPAYQLAIETGRHVYLTGDQIRVTARATFFDGTPVAGLPLRIDGSVERNLTTDQSGVATFRTVATPEYPEEGTVSYQSVSVSPARAEEGEITGATAVFAVFPSSVTVDAQSTIRAGRVRVEGGVNLVDVARLQAELDHGASIYDLDPRGKAVAGATVTVEFRELIPRRTRTGTEYDFIEKKTVPIYDYSNDVRTAGTITIETDANGHFSGSIPDSGADHDYDIVVSVSDADGRTAQEGTSASSLVISEQESSGPTLALTTPANNNNNEFGVGDSIDVTMRDPDTAQTATDGSRYLFYVAQRGIRDATIQSSRRFVLTAGDWAPPNFAIDAVRFTGTRYVGSPTYFATFHQSDRRLDVELSIPSERYAPGQDVTLNVLVRDGAGRPVAANVLLRATDEKLFSLGGAEEIDPLSDLYQWVDSGIQTTYNTHRAPRPEPEGGDTTGGGGDDRFDFRDTLLFDSIQTGADGRGSVSFRLSDDLTSWHVSATAVTADLRAGEGSVQVPVGLPFFVDASIAPEYLAADKPTIQVRTFGSALTTGAPVTISVVSQGLGFQAGPINARAFEDVAIPLPALAAGTQTVTISATFGSGASARTDKLTRSFVVVDSRLTRARASYVELGAAEALQGGDGLTNVVVSDASAGRYLPLLVDIASGAGARLDRSLAAALADALLKKHYAGAAFDASQGDFSSEPYQTQDGGLALLPYASSDLELSALVAIVAPDLVNRSALESYLTHILKDPAETRERRMYALGGLAGLNAPVLPDLQAAAANIDLTIRERLIVGLGAAALGDAASARSIERSLADAYGESLGQKARLRVGTSAADATAATAMMAVLAAAIGDPRGSAYWAYVEDNPSRENIFDLQAVAYVSRILERLPVQPASFAYTVDGKRKVVNLVVGGAYELTLTPEQRASVTFEQLAGAVAVTTSWREQATAASFQTDPDVTIVRKVTPARIKANDLVIVDLTVAFGGKAAEGCRQVTDLLPSGLVAIGSLAAWVEPDSGEPPADTVSPYAEAGQQVFFCADPTVRSRESHLRYYARVVTPGDYVWEPAVVDSQKGSDVAALTPQLEIEIR
jgi:alpha-2-macroglobulin